MPIYQSIQLLSDCKLPGPTSLTTPTPSTGPTAIRPRQANNSGPLYHSTVTQAPIVWFVSHCNAHSGRDKVLQAILSRLTQWLIGLQYIQWLRRWIGVDIFGRCGEKRCGAVKNVEHKYRPEQDPCFDMVNRKYR